MFIAGGLSSREQREPLVVIITGSDIVIVVAELPGAYKDYLRLNVGGPTLTLESIA